MWDFFKTKPLSEYTDDEIKEKLSFISIGANQNDVNNLINEAVKRGIKVRILDIGSTNYTSEFRRGKTTTLLSLIKFKLRFIKKKARKIKNKSARF